MRDFLNTYWTWWDAKCSKAYRVNKKDPELIENSWRAIIEGGYFPLVTAGVSILISPLLVIIGLFVYWKIDFIIIFVITLFTALIGNGIYNSGIRWIKKDLESLEKNQE